MGDLYSGSPGLSAGTGLWQPPTGLWGGNYGLSGPVSPQSVFGTALVANWDLQTTPIHKDFVGTATTTPGDSVALVFDNASWGGRTLASVIAAQTELRGNGVTGLVGSATAASYNTSTGAGSVSRVDFSNRSYVQWTVASNGWYAISVTNTGSVGINVRSTNNSVTVAVIAPGQSATVYATPVIGSILTIDATSVGTATFTVSSLKLVPGAHFYQSSAGSQPKLASYPRCGVRNLLLSTATMSTQSATVTAVAHTLSFKGTGTVTLSGASTAGPLVGTGASNRVSLTFTPTAGTLTLTVSGSVTEAQLEVGSTATAYQTVTTAYNVTDPTYPNDYVLVGDYVDDCVTFNGSDQPTGYRLTATQFGWMSSGPSAEGANARFSVGRTTRGTRVTGMSTSQAAWLSSSYYGVPQYTFVGTTTDSTVFHRIDSPSGPYTIRYVGKNGVVYDQTSNDVTTDLAAQGLTAPYTMLVPVAVANDTALTYFYCNNNQLTGSIPSLSNNTALTQFSCYNNQLTGSIPSLSNNTALTIFYCNNNQLTGSIHSLSANTALTQFYCYNNQLTGSIPSLSANTALTVFSCYNNQLTGSIPSLSANTALTYFYCYSNQLTGSIPSLSNNTALTQFYCGTNQLTGWAGGTVSATLGDFQAQDNLLPQATVDAILAAFVAAGRSTGTRVLNLGGTGNATPSATGLADKATLVSRGWTVTTN